MQASRCLVHALTTLCPVEPATFRAARDRVLAELHALLVQWVLDVGRELGLLPPAPPQELQQLQQQPQQPQRPQQQLPAQPVVGAPPPPPPASLARLCVSGSYRLGVNSPGGDIDAVVMTPAFVERRHFFGALVSRLRALCPARVTRLVPVPGARVPIITFSWSGVPVDLLFARLPLPSLPPQLNLVGDDSLLGAVDGGTMLSLNSVRVTELVAALVPHFGHFVVVLRAVRHWFRSRCMYSNKLGFLGGVNFNILVAFVCRLYPRQTPAKLLQIFFKVYAKWRWPNPVWLVPPYTHAGMEWCVLWARAFFFLFLFCFLCFSTLFSVSFCMVCRAECRCQC